MEPRPMLLDRRRFLKGAAFAGTAAALAACSPGGGSSTFTFAPPPSSPPSPVPSVTSPNPTPDSTATVLVKDVVEFELRGPYKWNGGSVTLRLHEGRLDGEPIYFVRTDASDEAFAKEVGLVFVPVLQLATQKEGGVGRIFLFGDDAAAGQLPVVSTGPGKDDSTPLFRVNRVTFTVLYPNTGTYTSATDGLATTDRTASNFNASKQYSRCTPTTTQSNSGNDIAF